MLGAAEIVEMLLAAGDARAMCAPEARGCSLEAQGCSLEA